MPHLLIEAGPGCGKTTTLCDAYGYMRATNLDIWRKRHKHTEEQLNIYKWCKDNLPETKPSEVVYLAYSNGLKLDLEHKITSGAKLYTLHGAGYSVLNKKYGYIKINSDRGKHLVEELIGQQFTSIPSRFEWIATLKHIEAIKQEMKPISVDSFEYVHDKYPELQQSQMHKYMVEQAHQIIPRMKVVDSRVGIEYIDQIWLPIFMLTKPIYKIGFVDEVQDFSAALLALARRLCENLVLCGDPNQSIMGFIGADEKSFDNIRTFVNTQLPLKTSFRLPPNLVGKANSHSPTARITTIKTDPGKEQRLTYETACDMLRNMSAMIIARTNASLVRYSLFLAKNGVQNRILGDSLVKNLCNIVKWRKVETVNDLVPSLMAYKENTAKKLKGIGKEVFEDKIDCILTVCDTLKMSDDVKYVEDKIKSMFSATKSCPVMLCTIHKSKGLEHNTIMILDGPVKHPLAQTQFELSQEHNLEFVAITRSKQDLYWVNK